MRGLTTTEFDACRAADVALRGYDKAKTSGDSAALIKARRRLEDCRSELEKLRADDPAACGIDLVRKALQRPVDHLGRPIDPVAKGGPRTVDHHNDRFDKLMRGDFAK